MNLKGVYEIFYPSKDSDSLSVWTQKPKYRSKKDFFEEIIPMEIRWINIRIWNDKARRSRFLSNSKSENTYLLSIKEMFLQEPFSIPRMERKSASILGSQIDEEALNKKFFQIVEQEKIELSSNLKNHLIDRKSCKLKKEWGIVLTFLFIYALFPEEINQLYIPYLYRRENDLALCSDENRKVEKVDRALFQYEYPPDMSVHYPGDILNHTWVMKNVGEVPWENRYYECSNSSFPLEEKNKKIPISQTIYPGDTVSLTVSFQVPDQPGVYMMRWKMKDSNGKMVYLDKFGLGLHFTVMENMLLREFDSVENNNYRVLDEYPSIPETLIAGKMYSHVWTIQNTGFETWNDYYLECINVESFRYAKNELRIPLKERVLPGESISIKVEFVTPPVESVCRFIWRFMKKDGTPAFADGRQLEVILNLI